MVRGMRQTENDVNFGSDARTAAPLLNVEQVSVTFTMHVGVFGRPAERLNAVNRVSFHVDRGESLGLVGESGCGKSTVARTILRLIPHATGCITFDGQSVFDLPPRQMQLIRRNMQIIFQDPAGSLNPRMRIGAIIAEPLLVHSLSSKRDQRVKVERLLARCGMKRSAVDRYPHEFSGGQRQRIAIARALALKPKLIICDEPTSALDVSVQAQILNLLKDLQDEYGVAYLFISHDLAVVDHFCDRIAVMKEGRIVEIGDRNQIITRPQHNYTKRLLAAIPNPAPDPAVGTTSIPLELPMASTAEA